MATTYNWRTFPKLLTIINYVLVLGAVNIASLTYSLTFEEYCKRNSRVYVVDRNLSNLKSLINEENSKHKKVKESEDDNLK